MTRVSTVLRMVARRWRDYVSYVLAVAFSVMVFFVFTSLRFAEELAAAAQASLKVDTLFQVSAVLVGVFAVIFLWYSASLFFARRHRETGMMLLMGMRQRSVAAMLFVENLLLGLTALVLGLVLGTLFHRLFVLVLLTLMRLPVSISASVDVRAYLVTGAAFALMIAVGGIGAGIGVYRLSLLRLFSAHAKSEEPPRLPWITAAAAIVCIGAGYGLAVHAADVSRISIALLLEIVGVTVAGTFLLFGGASYLIFRAAKARARRRCNAERLAALGQLAFRARKNARFLAMVAVLNAVSITGVGTFLAIYSDAEEIRRQIDARAPYDLSVVLEDPDGLSEAMAALAPDARGAIQETYTAKIGQTWYGMLAEGVSLDGIISLSTYRHLVDLRTRTGRGDPLPVIGSVPTGEAMMVARFSLDDEEEGPRVSALLQGRTVPLRADESGPTITSVYAGTLFSVQHIWNAYILVVDDETFAATQRDDRSFYVGVVDVADPQEDAGALTALRQQLPPETEPIIWLELFREHYGTTGLLLFIGVFIGVTLILANGSIIVFRQLMEAYETRHRYRLMHQLGFGERSLSRVIDTQQLLVFGLPYLVGLLHSFVALFLLDALIDIALWQVHLAVSGGFLVLYVLYARLNGRMYRRICAAS